MLQVTLSCSFSLYHFLKLLLLLSLANLVTLAAADVKPAEAKSDMRFAAVNREYNSPLDFIKGSLRVANAKGKIARGRGYRVAGRIGKTKVKRGYSYGETQIGAASWYGDAFHGRKTANGEIYDKDAISAAHPSFPLPCYTRVTNLNNGRSVIVRVNDRGPYIGNRIMDLSRRSAQALDFVHAGITDVMITYLGKATLDGKVDDMLLRTLRIDGYPASFAQAY